MEKYKLKWVDNVRLLAVIGVLSFHFWLQFGAPRQTVLQMLQSPHGILSMPFQLGWTADFLFFAISGLGLGLSATRKRKTWARFYVDRASRIYIPYWSAIVLMFAYQGIAYSVGTWDRLFVIPTTWIGWLKDILLLPQAPEAMLSTHFWFLPSLLVLYLSFPLIFWTVDKFSTWGFAACLILSMGARYLPFDLGWFRAAYTAFAWSPSFVIGAYIGVMLAKHPEQADHWLVRTIPLGILCLLIGVVIVPNDAYAWLANPLMGFGTLSVAGALGRLPWHLPKLTAISFEVYLIHMPFVGWYRHFFGFVVGPKIVLYAFFLISVAVMGAATYWVVSSINTKLKDGIKVVYTP
ncbi:acyltransferase family protein [Dyella nitratireducens]|uniref:Acyltransferase n=1 Tax=Dyella nitratireducens TaxID=1849580 RepID=A0ABQ1FQ33_9GAMM|nr:acyltransferase [Dyella nitratireducens]GGA25422.1 acyltransferase [Dyella nitratireducens]GLQ43690.1 acyltransferase [Dyella nitratireducens]